MKIRISEHDEFLLNRLLDGDLDAGQEAALRRRLQGEPDLKAAFDGLVRLDAALKACRVRRPELDQAAFHERLMQAVAAEPVPAVRTFRIRSTWWALVPLAAAAAIALVVWTRVPGDGDSLRSPPLARGPEPSAPAAAVPAGDERPAGMLAVRFVRPWQGAEAGPAAGEIKVRFVRSQELAERVRARDAAELAAPANFLYIAGVNRDGDLSRALLEAAAL